MRKRQGPLGPILAIVLGAGVNPDGSPSERTIKRAAAAAILAKAHPDLTVILTGNGPGDETRKKLSSSEASQMAKLLRQQGISRDRMRLEVESCDTIGNAVLVAARFLMGQAPRKVFIVTSPFHADRALCIFRGVLGPEWTVELCTSEIAEGDAIKGANESGGIEWAKRFFEKTTPGDFTTAINQLLEVGKPRYQKLRWLLRLRRLEASLL